MLFKLSIKNMKKSFKDYAIYFLTLVLGVAIFYMFNSLDSQEAMLHVSSSTREIVKLLVSLLSMVSVFVAIILGLLIVYANNFLISRRKKEFGIYMTLGMGKRQISKIILIETILVGFISLVFGLIIGVLGSQFMSILVAKLFEADMSEFQFVFSQEACVKTIIYFAIMYIAVILFNTISISRYKLIDLITATKKNEQIKIKNPILCIIIFLIAAVMLGYAYYKVTAGAYTLRTEEDILPIILIGIVATFLVFWSLSGFILKLVQSRRKLYLKDTNMFVLRQLNNKINTTVVSMTVICLMLFMTITILSTALSLRNSMQADLQEMTPVDLNLYKTANLPEDEKYTEEAIKDSRELVSTTLTNNGFDMNNLKDVVEIPIYATNELTMKDSLGNAFEEAKENFSMLMYDTAETIIKVSDYNKIARLYGEQEYTLNDNEYIILCDFDNMAAIRNQALMQGQTIEILGKEYVPKYTECQKGFIYMSTSHVNTGIIIVPDSIEFPEELTEEYFLAANYNANTDEEREKIEATISGEVESGFVNKIEDKGIELDGLTKISITESSVGLATIIVFVAIYLGIIFLIASSAILALKQLTESSDNKERYLILRKIGADEKMINLALFRQIGIFFLIPLVFAIIHSIFGIQFGMVMMAGLADSKDLLPSIIATVVVIAVVYGLYFLATYSGSKNIIKNSD